jgi:hypothetical protein
MSTEGVTVQVGVLVGLAGVVVTAQVKLTLPVNPFDGATVIVAVSPVVAPATKVSAPLLLSAIPGAGRAVTVTATPVFDVMPPAAVPVTVAV